MRRFFTIIFILIVIVAIVLGILWFGARKTATQNNAPKPTFREFVTGSTKQGQGTGTPDGTLSSSFTEDTQGQPVTSGTLTPGQTPSIDGSLSAPGTQTSTFTNDTLLPTSPTGSTSGTPGTTGGTTLSGSPTQTADTTPTGTGITPYNPSSPGSTTTGGTQPTTPTGGSGSVAQCSEADTNIVFTPSELAELKSLERRFYTIAESIRTDEDIAREVTNHDTFKLKGDQILELYNYCAQKSPRLTTPSYQKRVATPFWNSTSSDTNGFITERTNQVRFIESASNLGYGKARLEYALKLNLW